MKSLKIGYLYPKLLNIYGDGGNVITLKKRCEWRNIEVTVDEINIGDSDIGSHDIYFIGGGQDIQQIAVSKELQKHITFLTEERDRGAVFLGICGGYQLFGHYYLPHNGEKLLGISLLDAYTVAGDKRFIGNVTAINNNLEPNTLVGFENHSGLTYLQGDTKPLATIKIGNGNNGQDKTEGARYKNVFGTYMHGSFLPKNPHFADYLLELAIGEKLEKLEDNVELNAHNSLINKSY
jgi:CobQ-like glutamine amidotransferase family enzyme